MANERQAGKRAAKTPAQDRLMKLLRERGEVRRRDALRVVSASTVARAAAAGKVVRIVRGRAVFLAAPVTAAATAPVVRMSARRPAPEGVPGGRLAAMTALLSGAGRTAGERAADFFFLGR